jgi:hypothetical protein
LESLVRRRVRETPNVALVVGHDAADLTTTSSRDRITGVRRVPQRRRRTRVGCRSGGRRHGARRPNAFRSGRPWLRSSAEEKVAVNVAYSSQLLRISPGTLREMVVATTPVPGRPTGMALFGCENDTWMFTAFGMAGREPPTEPDDRPAFVEAITPPHVMEALRNAEPLSEICRYRYPENRWRRTTR